MNFQGDREVPAAQRPTIEGKDREMFAKDLAQSMISVDSGNGYHFAQDKTEVDGSSVRVTYDCCQSSSSAPKARLAHDVLAATSHTSCSVPLSSSPSQSIAPKARREGRTGMDRFPCRGRFSIRYNSQRRVVTVKARQAIPHIKYQRIDVPFEVEERIREILSSGVASNPKAKDVLAVIHEDFDNQYYWISDDQIRNRITEYRLGNDPMVSTKRRHDPAWSCSIEKGSQHS
ncbi:hypothetical protein J005_02429 [Cryptococcus neoformans]|nr:hypothetical protein C344_02351 [Cryptococcus neoformans var. grubii AD1-7a]OXH34773.1 hypothetical protein J005_02429 [Cryptococcus neoformans var. grubii]